MIEPYLQTFEPICLYFEILSKILYVKLINIYISEPLFFLDEKNGWKNFANSCFVVLITTKRINTRGLYERKSLAEYQKIKEKILIAKYGGQTYK